jgi:hypothetical protein
MKAVSRNVYSTYKDTCMVAITPYEMRGGWQMHGGARKRFLRNNTHVTSTSTYTLSEILPGNIGIVRMLEKT